LDITKTFTRNKSKKECYQFLEETTLRIRQEVSVTRLLLESVSGVYGTSEIGTRSALQRVIKQTNNFTKEKRIDPLCV
jgi:hypothetical protein